MNTVSLVLLRCPACGHELPAAENDVVFACVSCARAFEIRGAALAEVPLVYAKCEEKGAALHLPFWWHRVTLKLACRDPRFEKAMERFDAIKNIFVSAVSMRGFHAFGDPGVAFTQRRIEPVPDSEARGATVAGGARSSEDARKWAPLIVLAQVDRLVDVSAVSMSMTREEESLLAVPFFDEGTHLRDGLAGERWSKAAFMDLHGVENAVRKARRAA